MTKLPPKVTLQIIRFSIPIFCLSLYSANIHLSLSCGFTALICSVVPYILEDSVGKLYISSALMIAYIVLGVVSRQRAYIIQQGNRMINLNNILIDHLLLGNAGFILSQAFSTRILLTVNTHKTTTLIHMVGLFVSICFTPNLLTDFVCLILLMLSFTTNPPSHEVNRKGHNNRKDTSGDMNTPIDISVLESMKYLIDDDILRCAEYKQFVMECFSYDPSGRIFPPELFKKDFSLRILFYFLSKNKLLLIMCSVFNILLDLHCPLVELLIISLIIMDIPWEYLAIFYSCKVSRNIPCQIGIGLLSMYLISNMWHIGAVLKADGASTV